MNESYYSITEYMLLVVLQMLGTLEYNRIVILSVENMTF